MTFGERLKILRVWRGYTQTGFEKAAGFSKGTYPQYELGYVKNPRGQVREKLARGLDVPEDVLTGDAPMPEEAMRKWGPTPEQAPDIPPEPEPENPAVRHEVKIYVRCYGPYFMKETKYEAKEQKKAQEHWNAERKKSDAWCRVTLDFEDAKVV